VNSEWSNPLPLGAMAQTALEGLVPSNVLEDAKSLEELVPFILKNGIKGILSFDSWWEDSDPIEGIENIDIIGNECSDYAGSGEVALVLDRFHRPVGWWCTTTNHQALCDIGGAIVWRDAWRRVARWWGEPSPPDYQGIESIIKAIRGENVIIVTRHPALVEYLQEQGIVVQGECDQVSHATPEDVRGKHVIGVLPLRLAAEAATVTEIPLDIPPELRGTELSIEQLREYGDVPVTYRVERI